MKILRKIEKNRSLWFVIGILFLFFLLRLPSLFEPYWYGDEGIDQTLGMAMSHGRLLYRDIWDNKPPLLYIVYNLLESDQFATKTASLATGGAACLTFFFLAKKLFSKDKKSKLPILSTLIFTLILGLPVIEGNIANAENFMILPITISALLIFRHDQIKIIKKTKVLNWFLFAIGALLGIAFLFKIVAVFDFLAFYLFILLMHKPHGIRNLLNTFKKLLLFPIGFIFPVILTSVFFIVKGAFFYFLQAILIQNIGYVGYENYFIIPQGLLLIRITILCIFLVFVTKIKDKISTAGVFILIWFGFSMFNAFFSNRPYLHYLLVVLPSTSLFVCLIFWEKKYRKILVLILFVSLFAINSNFNFYTKSIGYYNNFISFITNKISTNSYYSFFDSRTPIDYEVAAFLKTKININDTIFVWGNNPQIYKMTGALPPGKYVAAYHVASFPDGIQNTSDAIDKTKPKFIVIMPYETNIPFSLSNYIPRGKIQDVLIYERVF